jgi:hypothetical protein
VESLLSIEGSIFESLLFVLLYIYIFGILCKFTFLKKPL